MKGVFKKGEGRRKEVTPFELLYVQCFLSFVLSFNPHVTGEVGIIIHFTEEKSEAGAEVMACTKTYSSHAAGLLWEFLQSLSKALASCH